MTVKEECTLIADRITFLTEGPWLERKELLKEIHYDGATTIDGYIYKKDLYCWLIWKPTDIREQPEYKGEPLLKVVPFNVPLRNVEKVLLLQPWTYQ